jgi:probable rRNA maturation factor
VEILDETARFPAPDTDALRGALERLLEAAELSDRGVTVVLVDDATMRERNRIDRGVDAPTDVLSYPTVEPDDVGMPEVAHLGDVFIDLDQAARQASEHGHDLVREVLVLAAHGLTHLRGFDHPDEASWAPFLEAQRRVLEGRRS